MTNLEELPARIDNLAREILQLRIEMRAEFSAVRTEMHAGDDRIMTQARMLHEELIARLALLQEGQPKGLKPRKKTE